MLITEGGGTGKTDAEMKTGSTFTDAGWDFESIWGINPSINSGYPYLLSSVGDGGSGGALIVQPENDASKAILIEQQEGTEICGNFDDGVTTNKESQLSVQDPQYDYPSYFIGFTLGGCDVGGTVTIHAIFTGDFNPDTTVLRKYNVVTEKYATITTLTKTATTLNDLPALDVTYQVTDGGELDEDGTANGAIVDPIGLGVQVSTQPTGSTTLADTGQSSDLYIALSVLLVFTGLSSLVIRKRVFSTIVG